METEVDDTRRGILRAALGCALLPLPGLAAATGSVNVAGCRVTRTGGYVLSLVDGASGVSRIDLELPGRGHGVLHHAGVGELLAFARRPGDFLVAADVSTGALKYLVQAARDRHYGGHGVFSGDGRWLFATENDFESGRGVIGVYDAEDCYRRVDEFDSGGTGPHELVRLPGQEVLAVANGGLRTHPDFPREILNVDSMRPNLAVLDAQNGRRLAVAEPPAALHQLSIRHLAASDDGRLCIGMQYQGPRDARPPLVAFSDGDSLEPVAPPPAVLDRMRNYCGSVAWLAAANRFAVSSPHEGLITLWSSESGFSGALDVRPDTSAICAEDGGRVLWAGGGEALQRVRHAGSVDMTSTSDGYFWDNHMIVM